MKLISKSTILPVVGIAVGITSSVVGLSTAAASAASASPNSQPSSSIARSVVREDRLQAMAGALDLSTAQVQAHLKAHDLKQVVANAGLNTETFHQKVLDQLKSKLQAQGYSQTQIDGVLQHYQAHSNRH